MRRLLFAIALLFITFGEMHGQLTGNGTPPPCVSQTNYTDGSPNDAIYYYQANQLGSLTATPPSGTPGWTFIWSKFNSSLGQWFTLITQNNLPSSTLNNLQPGAYMVVVKDGAGNVVGIYKAWIARINAEPDVTIDPIEGDCNGPITLNGTIQNPVVTEYSNLPPNQIIISPTSQITVCFNFIHDWVSDLGFQLRGPSSCGSPIVYVFPPTGNVCNSGDNGNNLCFTTQPAGNFSMCGASTPLTGTYSTYNTTTNTFVPINWAPFYGCDASATDWVPVVVDAYGANVGTFTSSTVTLTGTNLLGEQQTVTYTYGPATIFDGSTSNPTYAIPSVNVPSYPPITCNFGFQWTSEPPLTIPNATTALNIPITQLNDVNGNPINWQDVDFTLSITSPCTGVLNCLGGNMSATEPFILQTTEDAVIDNPGSVCISGDPITMTATPANGTWSGTGITNSATGEFDPAVAGIGDHVITYTPEDACYSVATYTVNVSDLPTLQISSSADYCIDGTDVQLTSPTPGGTWSGTATTSSGMFSPTTAGIGTYTISYSVGGSCPVSVTKDLTVHELPVINAGSDATICSGSATQLQASGGVSYVWSPSTGMANPNIANPSATPPSDNFTYTVVGTDAHGCSSSDAVTLTFFDGPSVTAMDDPDIICPGSPLVLNASGTTNTGQAGSYQWSPSVGVTNPSSATPTVSPYETTTYTVTFTDNCGLSATDYVIVTTELFHSVNLPATASYCEGEDVLLQATVTGTSPSLLWTSSVAGFDNSAHTTSSLLVNQPGSYTLTVTSPMGCTHADQTVVTQIPLPNPYMPSPVDLCPNKTVTLSAGNNWDMVHWSNGQTNPSITVSSPGTFTATVTHNGCTNTASVTVELIQMPVVNLGPDISICDGTSATLTIPANGQWSTGAYSNSIQVSTANTYYVTVHKGSCITSDTIDVRVKPRPIAKLPDQVVGCLEGTAAINASNPVNTSYLWSTGEATPMIEVSDFGTYSVTVFNDCGNAKDSTRAYFQDCSYAIYIPNTFTPDNDGINEVWKLSTYNVRKLTLWIFNRWGDVVFITHDINPVWTGEVSDGGYFAPDGAYTYYLKYETENGELGERSGDLLILR